MHGLDLPVVGVAVRGQGCRSEGTPVPAARGCGLDVDQHRAAVDRQPPDQAERRLGKRPPEPCAQIRILPGGALAAPFNVEV